MSDENKFNQKKLNGFETILKQVKLSDIITECVSRHGLVTLANELNIDKSALSRFKNGEGSLPLEQIERLFDFCELVAIEQKRYQRLVSTIMTMSDLLKDSLSW